MIESVIAQDLIENKFFDELSQFANMKECKVFKSLLPPTDDSIEAFTLLDRYDSYYPHIRKLAIEVVKDLGIPVKRSQLLHNSLIFSTSI